MESRLRCHCRVAGPLPAARGCLGRARQLAEQLSDASVDPERHSCVALCSMLETGGRQAGLSVVKLPVKMEITSHMAMT